MPPPSDCGSPIRLWPLGEQAQPHTSWGPIHNSNGRPLAKKLLRISRQWQQSSKPSSGPFSALGPQVQVTCPCSWPRKVGWGVGVYATPGMRWRTSSKRPDRHKAKEDGKRPAGEQGRPWAWRRDTQGHLKEQWGIHRGGQAPPRGPVARPSPVIRAPLSEHWQELKWEKVEAAEAAMVETSIFTLAGGEAGQRWF